MNNIFKRYEEALKLTTAALAHIGIESGENSWQGNLAEQTLKKCSEILKGLNNDTTN